MVFDLDGLLILYGTGRWQSIPILWQYRHVTCPVLVLWRHGIIGIVVSRMRFISIDKSSYVLCKFLWD